MHEEDVGSDCAVLSDDGLSAEDGGIGVDGHVVLHVGMALVFLDHLAAFVLGKTARTKSNAMIQLHIISDHKRFSDHDSGAVIDEEVGADAGSRMGIDSSAGVCPFLRLSA